MIARLYETDVTKHALLPMSAICTAMLEDAASSYALFALTAFGRDCIHQRSPGTEAIGFKLKSIQLVNKRLMQSWEASDGTIMAVILLWNLEVRVGSSINLWRCLRHWSESPSRRISMISHGCRYISAACSRLSRVTGIFHAGPKVSFGFLLGTLRSSCRFQA